MFRSVSVRPFVNVAAFMLIGLAGAYLLFPTGFDNIIMPYSSAQPWWALLDTSWMITLNYINIQHMGWGSDVAFTYGPLGYLSTRLGWGESRLAFLLSDLFFFANWGLVFYFSLRNSRNKLLTFGLIVIIALFLPIWVGGKMSLYILLFLAFWIRQNLEHKTVLGFIMQIILIALGFYIKFNSALLCLPLYFLGIGFMAYRRKLNLAEILIYCIVPLALIYALSIVQNVSLIGYIATGWELISGYNEIMYEDVPLPGTRLYLVLITAIVAFVMGVNFFGRKDQNLSTRFFLVILAAVPFFVAYKQGFTRSNPGYNADFFACVLVFFLTTSDLHYQIRSRALKALMLLTPLVAVHYLYIKSEKPFEILPKFSKLGYIEGFRNFTPNSDRFFKEGSPKLPPGVMAKLGRHTVDVYPWNIRMLIENGVNYLPRPTLQSYSAYTPGLENLNFGRYNKVATAPDYVIYEFGSLDGRYPLFDEPKVMLALKLNYSVDETFEYDTKKMLLLKKKQNFKPIRFELLKEYAITLNGSLRPNSGTYYQIKHYADIKGKLYGVFFHAPALTLDIKCNDNQNRQFKTSDKLLQSGLFGDDFAESIEDFASMGGSGQSSKRVSYYHFKPDNPSFFGDKVRVKEFRILQ